MFKIILILIFSPIVILMVTMLVCALISAGFELIVKIALLAAIICGCKYVFSITRGRVP